MKHSFQYITPPLPSNFQLRYWAHSTYCPLLTLHFRTPKTKQNCWECFITYYNALFLRLIFCNTGVSPKTFVSSLIIWLYLVNTFFKYFNIFTLCWIYDSPFFSKVFANYVISKHIITYLVRWDIPSHLYKLYIISTLEVS